MKTGVCGARVGVLFLATVVSSVADVTQQDTEMPNRFEFTHAEYVVAENATNATITVRFYPGNRSISGAVDYHTEDGTAIAQHDYMPVAGRLFFSGWANRSFDVPVIWDAVDESDQTVVLQLGAITPLSTVGPRKTAILRITNVDPPAKLRLARGSDSVTVSWLDDGVARLLEKTGSPSGGNWTHVTNSPVNVAGRFYITNNCSGAATFYRLRKP